VKKRFVAWLKAEREKAGYATWQELAVKLDVQLRLVQKWAGKGGLPDTEHYQALLDVFGETQGPLGRGFRSGGQAVPDVVEPAPQADRLEQIEATLARIEAAVSELRDELRGDRARAGLERGADHDEAAELEPKRRAGRPRPSRSRLPRPGTPP
jgi:hypothetical protein